MILNTFYVSIRLLLMVSLVSCFLAVFLARVIVGVAQDTYRAILSWTRNINGKLNANKRRLFKAGSRSA